MPNYCICACKIRGYFVFSFLISNGESKIFLCYNEYGPKSFSVFKMLTVALFIYAIIYLLGVKV